MPDAGESSGLHDGEARPARPGVRQGVRRGRQAVKRLATALAALTAAIMPAHAEQIRCVAQGESPVSISLKSQRYAGRDLSCISGSFVAGLTPCAPLKAFSLSAPTGPAAIVGVVDRWQDYAKHDGGVVGYFKSHTTIAFTGGFNTPSYGLQGRLVVHGRPAHQGRHPEPEGRAQGRVLVRRGRSEGAPPGELRTACPDCSPR